MDATDYSISRIDRACDALYGSDVATNQEAHDYLFKMLERDDADEILTLALTKSKSSHTTIFATYGYDQLAEKKWRYLSTQKRFNIRTWCMNWLFLEGPAHYEKRSRDCSQIIAGIIRLLGVITTNGWLEMSSSGRFMKDFEVFLNSDNTLHWIIAMETLNHVVQVMNPKENTNIRKRKTAESFRESVLGTIFHHACRILVQWGDQTLRVSEKWMESHLLLHSISTIAACLTFDFTGESPDDSADDNVHILMIPFSWKVYNIARLPSLLFSVLNNGMSDSSEKAKECMLQCFESLAALASIRRTFFHTQTDIDIYISTFISEIELLTRPISPNEPAPAFNRLLEDDALYHGYAELSGRIMSYCLKTNIKMVTLNKWVQWIETLHNFSIEAFSQSASEELENVRHEILKAWVDVPNILRRVVSFTNSIAASSSLHKTELVKNVVQLSKTVFDTFVHYRFASFGVNEEDLMDVLLNDMILQEQMELAKSFMCNCDSEFYTPHKNPLSSENASDKDPEYMDYAQRCMGWLNLVFSMSAVPGSSSYVAQATWMLAVATAYIEGFNSLFTYSSCLSTTSRNSHIINTAELCKGMIQFIHKVKPISQSLLQEDQSNTMLEGVILDAVQSIMSIIIPEYYTVNSGKPTLLRYIYMTDIKLEESVPDDACIAFIDHLMSILMDRTVLFHRSIDSVDYFLRHLRARPSISSDNLYQNGTSHHSALSLTHHWGFSGPVLCHLSTIKEFMKGLATSPIDELLKLFNSSNLSVKQLYSTMAYLDTYNGDNSVCIAEPIQQAWNSIDAHLKNAPADSTEYLKPVKYCMSAVEGILTTMNNNRSHLISNLGSSYPSEPLFPKWLNTIVIASRRCYERMTQYNNDIDSHLEEYSGYMKFISNTVYLNILRNEKDLDFQIVIPQIIELVHSIVLPYVTFFLQGNSLKIKDPYAQIQSDCATLDLISLSSKCYIKHRQLLTPDKAQIINSALDMLVRNGLSLLLRRDSSDIQHYEIFGDAILKFIDLVTQYHIEELFSLEPLNLMKILEIINEGLYSHDEMTLHRIIRSISSICEWLIKIQAHKRDGDHRAQSIDTESIMQNTEAVWDRMLATIYRLISTSSTASISWAFSRPFLALCILRPHSIKLITDETLETIDTSRQDEGLALFDQLHRSIKFNTEVEPHQMSASDFPSQLFEFVTLQKNLFA